MDIFTVHEWEKNFDELFARVENGETIGIINDKGEAAIMAPSDDFPFHLYTENNNEAP